MPFISYRLVLIGSVSVEVGTIMNRVHCSISVVKRVVHPNVHHKVNMDGPDVDLIYFLNRSLFVVWELS